MGTLWVPTVVSASDMDNDPLLLKVASLALLETAHDTAEKDACIVPRHLWQKWVDEQTTEVLLVEIQQRNHRHVLCVDSYHSKARDLLYLPSQVCMDLDMDEYVEVNVLQETPPIATKIVLEPLEADTYGFDIAGATSEYLSHWNVLKAGTTLSVPSLEIEGFSYMIHVASTEPAPIVLLRGEVPMELVELPEGGRPPTPIPYIQSPLLAPSKQQDPQEDFNSFLPLPPAAATPPPTKPSFTPFGGQGRRLGS